MANPIGVAPNGSTTAAACASTMPDRDALRNHADMATILLLLGANTGRGGALASQQFGVQLCA
jgi:hypothetical protein